jgi:hypothetical protein
MKKSTLFHISVALLLLGVASQAGAQDYLLTSRGDSLVGEVKPLLYGPQQKVQLISADNEKTTFSVFEVREFSQGGDVFRPLKGEKGGYVFMKLMHAGYLALYAFQQENQSRFEGQMLRKLDGDQLVVPNLGFKKYIGQFIADCPEVAARVKAGELGKRNLDELLNAYNACIENRTVDRVRQAAGQRQENGAINAWNALEEKVKQKEFAEKSNALEMIAEIKNKVRLQEKIPNFLAEGLKSSLKDTGLSEELDSAMREVQESARP